MARRPGSRAEQLLDEALAGTADPVLRANASTCAADDALPRRSDRRSSAARRRGSARREPCRGLAADLMASAFHSAMFTGDAASTLETAATLAELASDAPSTLDARVSTLTGAALITCGRLDAAEPYLRRSLRRSGRSTRRARTPTSWRTPVTATGGCASTRRPASWSREHSTARANRETPAQSGSRPSH